MDTENNITKQSFDSPGARLNHLLDQIGFRQGRGRSTELQSYLIKHSPDLFSDSNTKYTTVRSWLLDAAPSMRKIDAIIQALQKQYTIDHDISQIKTWWKLGGLYPFSSDLKEARPSAPQLEQSAKEYEEALQFIVMPLVAQETADFDKTLTSRDLMLIKDKVVKFGNDFADPFKTECPIEYLKMAVKHELSVILEQKIRSR